MSDASRQAKKDARAFVVDSLRSQADRAATPAYRHALTELAGTLERQWRSEKTRTARKREAAGR